MATTNFFRQMASLEIVGNLQLTIARGTDNKMIVSVLLQNDECSDNAKLLIPTMVLRESAQVIDENFFECITNPIEKTSSLMEEMDKHMKQLEEVRKQSALEKDKVDKEKKARDDRDKKYREAMAEVDKLDKEGKPKDAWTRLSKIQGYPEYTEEIAKRRTELTKQFAPDLFGAVDDTPKEPPITETLEETEDDLFSEDEISNEH